MSKESERHGEAMRFEDAVRRTAEALWDLAPGACQPEYYSDDIVIRELDGIARLRDVTHLIMATTSRKLDKTKSDVRKLQAAAKLEARRQIPVTMWLITQEHLDAEHIRFAKEAGVTTLTLRTFRERFFDGSAYIARRRGAAFGSARNLADGSITIPENEYVDLPAYLHDGPQWTPDSRGALIDVGEIAERLSSGEIVIMLAPFGSGKSLTTREVFFTLARARSRDETSHVPIAVNLREHWGAEYADEILERHARLIGFVPKENLTVAWRAGLITLLLDGFDEMAGQVLAAREDAEFLREIRRNALSGVRHLVSSAPAGVGVLIAGREHYFDSNRELAHALGLVGRRYSIVTLGEFTEEQAREFLERQGLSDPLPDWLPRKPLLLGYLAHRGLLVEILRIDATRGFGHAWDAFLNLVCEREAAHERAAMDPHTIRRVLERLALGVRATAAGTGPVSTRDLAEAYKVETGQNPGEGALMQLQRLPGFTEREQDPGLRSFVDEDMLAALQGSAVAGIVLGTVVKAPSRGWVNGLSRKAAAMTSHLLATAGADQEVAVTRSWSLVYPAAGAEPEPQLAADVLAVAVDMAADEGVLDCRGIVLEGVDLAYLDLENIRINGLVLRNCTIGTVTLGTHGIDSEMRMEQCSIGRVAGVNSEDMLPGSMFAGCSVDEFDAANTNNAVLALAIPAPMKALLTVLRKLYLQAGGGRKRSALKRGLPGGNVASFIPEVLHILEQEGVIVCRAESVQPVRRETSRVRAILGAPMISDDPIAVRVRAIAS